MPNPEFDLSESTGGDYQEPDVESYLQPIVRPVHRGSSSPLVEAGQEQAAQQDIARQEQSQQQERRTLNTFKLADLGRAGIPATTDPQTNDVVAMRDNRGKVLTQYDQKNQIAYDSAGEPQSIQQDGTSKPAYEGIPDWTDNKTGDIYKRVRGLPDKWVGKDADVSGAIRQAEIDKLNRTASAAIGGRITQTQAGLHAAMLDTKQSFKPLMQSGLISPDPSTGLYPQPDEIDPQALKGQVEASYQAGMKGSQANEKGWFGMGDLSPAAQAERQRLADQRDQSIQMIDRHVENVARTKQYSTAIDQMDNQRAQLGDEHIDEINRKRAALGQEPIVLPQISEALDAGGTPESHSPKWLAMQSQMTNDAKAAGLPDVVPQQGESVSRLRLMDAIGRAKSAGYDIPHFIGTQQEPEGDRAPTMDTENLVKALDQQQQDLSKSGEMEKAATVGKERDYWQKQIAGGMSKEQWKTQTGEDDPAYPQGNTSATASVPGQTATQQDVTPATQQAIQDARAGQKPYAITENGGLQFDEKTPVAGVKQAARDGLIDPAKAGPLVQAAHAFENAQADQRNDADKTGGWFEQIGKSTLTGVSQLLRSFAPLAKYNPAGLADEVLKGLGIIKKGTSDYMQAAGDELRTVAKNVDVNPTFEGSAAGKAINFGVGSVFFLTSAAVNPVAGAVVGSRMMGQSMADEAEDALKNRTDLTEDQKQEKIQQMNLLGNGIGMLSALPFGRLISALRAGEPLADSAVRTLATSTATGATSATLGNMGGTTMLPYLIQKGLKGAGQGAAAMSAQTIAANAGFKLDGIDPERGYFQGVPEAMIGGGLVGMVMGAAAGHAGFKSERNRWETVTAAFAKEWQDSPAVSSAAANYAKTRNPSDLASVIHAVHQEIATSPSADVAGRLEKVLENLGIKPTARVTDFADDLPVEKQAKGKTVGDEPESVAPPASPTPEKPQGPSGSSESATPEDQQEITGLQQERDARVKELAEGQGKVNPELLKAVQGRINIIDARIEQIQPKTTFTTAKGSEYSVEDSGRTTRLKKSEGKGRGEIHDPMHAVYVPPEVAAHFEDSVRDNDRVVLTQKQEDGTYKQLRPEAGDNVSKLKDLHVSFVNRETGEHTASFPAANTPKIGLHPFEIEYSGETKRFHMGNKITEVRTPKGGESNEPSPESISQQLPPEPRSQIPGGSEVQPPGQQPPEQRTTEASPDAGNSGHQPGEGGSGLSGIHAGEPATQRSGSGGNEPAGQTESPPAAVQPQVIEPGDTLKNKEGSRYTVDHVKANKVTVLGPEGKPIPNLDLGALEGKVKSGEYQHEKGTQPYASKTTAESQPTENRSPAEPGGTSPAEEPQSTQTHGEPGPTWAKDLKDARGNTDKALKRALKTHQPHAERLGANISEGPTKAPSGIATRYEFGPKGELDISIQHDSDKLAKNWQIVNEQRGKAVANSWVSTAMDEEIRHYRDLLVSGHEFDAIHQKIWNLINPAAKGILKDAYKDKLDGISLAAEFVRMVSQRRAGLMPTEWHLEGNFDKLLPFLDAEQPDFIEHHLASMDTLVVDPAEMGAAEPSEPTAQPKTEPAAAKLDRGPPSEDPEKTSDVPDLEAKLSFKDFKTLHEQLQKVARENSKDWPEPNQESPEQLRDLHRLKIQTAMDAGTPFNAKAAKEYGLKAASKPSQKKPAGNENTAAPKATEKPTETKLSKLDQAAKNLKDKLNAGELAAANPDVRPNELGFYSKLEKVIADKMPNRASAEQVRGLIASSGVKKDEIQWSGIDDWLKDAKEPLNKAVVLDFVRGNGIKVQEKALGDKAAIPESLNRYFDDTKDDIPTTPEEWSALSEKMMSQAQKYQARGNKQLSDRLFSLSEDAGRVAEGVNYETGSTKDQPKFSQYQLPGADPGTYREVLLTLPVKSMADDWKVIPSADYDGEFDVVDKSGRVRYSSGDRSDADQYIEDAQENGFESKDVFKSSHFDEPNILAHARINERSTTDGENVLHAEEIQSDWHQKGRKEGYKTPLTKSEQSELDAISKLTTSHPLDGVDTTKITDAQRTRARELLSKGKVGTVPDAPFKTTWPALVLKRILRIAAEKGKDGITWTDGATQAERYDLSKHVDDVQFVFDPKTNTGDLTAYKAGKSVIEKGDINASELPEYIGKDLAKKLMEQSQESAESMGLSKHKIVQLSGGGLKIEHEGMKGFYDTILPSVANDIGKKFGARVQQKQVSTGDVIEFQKWKNANYPGQATDEAMRKEYELHQRGLGGATVHYLPITDAMRESVLGEGQALFAASPAKSAIADKETRLAAMEYADALIESGVTDPKQFAESVQETMGWKRPQSISALWNLARASGAEIPEVTESQWEKYLSPTSPEKAGSAESQASTGEPPAIPADVILPDGKTATLVAMGKKVAVVRVDGERQNRQYPKGDVRPVESPREIAAANPIDNQGQEYARFPYGRLPAAAKEILDGTRLLPKGSGGILQAAALDVRREARAIQEEQGTTFADGERQALVQWAVRNKLVIPPKEFAGKIPDEGGIEHDVFVSKDSDLVTKITKDKPVQIGYHLDRLLLQNVLFGDEIELKGVTFHPSTRVAIVTTQPYYKGTHPSQDEIDKTLASDGYEKLVTDEQGRGVYGGNGVTVADAGPKNWIKSEAGDMMLFDPHVQQSGELGAATPDLHVKARLERIAKQRELTAEEQTALDRANKQIDEDAEGPGDYGTEMVHRFGSARGGEAPEFQRVTLPNGKTGTIVRRNGNKATISLDEGGLTSAPISTLRIEGELGAQNPFPTIYAKGQDALALQESKSSIAGQYDAAGNIANYRGGQAGNKIRLHIPDKEDREAMPFVIEAGHDASKIQAFRGVIQASVDPKLVKKYEPVINRAIRDFTRLDALRDVHDNLMSGNLKKLASEGIDVREVEHYVTRKLDLPESVKQTLPSPMFQMGSGQGSSPKYFTKGRSFETLPDAIRAGYAPKSTDLAELDGHRIEMAEKMIEQKRMVDKLKATPSPTDGKPIIGELQARQLPSGRTEMVVPHGYTVVNAYGRPLVIHDHFASIFGALFGRSVIRQSVAGRAAIKAAALVKQGTLVLDTFHAGRLFYKMSIGGGGLPVTRRDGKLAWNMHEGLSVLEYEDADLQLAVQAGEITQEEADNARKIRPDVERLLAHGLNVGKVSDNLMQQAKLHIPLISTFNEWLFGKLARGAMLQTALVAYERNLRNGVLTPDAAARRTAKEMNEMFGNLQNQGIFTSKTMQDIARLVFLAPNWAESQFRNEARAYGQAGKSAGNFIRSGGKDRFVGNSARAMAIGVVALLLVNQLINFITRGKFTWQNEEKHHGLDAWIPGGPNGFWFNPFELAGEYLHAAFKYLAQNENPLDVATHILSNKMAPMARALKEAVTGRDYAGRHYLSNADRARAAVTDALPMPLGFNSFLEKDPRQTFGYRLTRQPAAAMKQVLQSMGAKVTAGQSPTSQMFALAHPFRPDRGYADTAGEYTELRRALDNKDDSSAMQEIKWLANRGKTAKNIREAVGMSASGIQPLYFTGSKNTEGDFITSLSTFERGVYGQAQQDHVLSALRLNSLLGRNVGQIPFIQPPPVRPPFSLR